MEVEHGGGIVGHSVVWPGSVVEMSQLPRLPRELGGRILMHSLEISMATKGMLPSLVNFSVQHVLLMHVYVILHT